jgi:hypothetical protein
VIWSLCPLDTHVSYKPQFTTVSYLSLNTVNQVLAGFCKEKPMHPQWKVSNCMAVRWHTISPALAKIFSDGVDVPGIPKHFSTNVNRRGYQLAFNFHHSNGLILIAAQLWLKSWRRPVMAYDVTAYAILPVARFWRSPSVKLGETCPLRSQWLLRLWVLISGYPDMKTGTRVRYLFGYPGTRSEHKFIYLSVACA